MPDDFVDGIINHVSESPNKTTSGAISTLSLRSGPGGEVFPYTDGLMSRNEPNPAKVVSLGPSGEKPTIAQFLAAVRAEAELAAHRATCEVYRSAEQESTSTQSEK
jgi:hypothetical protein